MARTPLHATLTELLAALRSVTWHAWTKHWKTTGSDFYSDHLLFQRVYSGDGGGPNIEAQTDGLGERMVALYGPSGVDEIEVQELVLKHLKSIRNQDPIQGALSLETQILNLGAKAAKLTTHLPPQYSIGLDNFIRELVDARSTVVYLLQQRLSQSPNPNSYGEALGANPLINDGFKLLAVGIGIAGLVVLLRKPEQKKVEMWGTS